MPIDTDADASEVVLLDTSAAIPFIVKDHDHHDITRAHLRGKRLGLAGHAWFESYAVLTRLSGGRRRSPAEATRLLAQNFPASEFLSEVAARKLSTELARLTISGGAVYDALVGAASREHGQTLVSRDARAQPTYEALGVVSEVIR
jgi:predicted nucleic acid-binding protein